MYFEVCIHNSRHEIILVILLHHIKYSIFFIIFKFFYQILQHAIDSKYLHLFQNTPRNDERELN